MPELLTFSYTAVDVYGHERAGTMQAESATELLQKLKEQGLTPLKYTQATTAKKQTWIGNVKMKEIIPFTYHLKTLYGAGVPLLSGLEDLKQQTKNPNFEKILTNVSISLKNGSSLSEALANYPGTFPPIYLGLTRVGEATGNLDTALERLAKYLERREDTKGRVIQAMIYPIVLCIAVIMLVLVLLLWLLPKLKKMYESSGVELPGVTLFVVSISDFLYNNALILLAVTIAVIGFLFYCRINPFLRLKMDQFLLKVPGLGPLLTKDSASAFCNTLATLYKAGIDVNESLKYCEEVIPNEYIKKTIRQASLKIQEGTKIPDAIAGTGAFPPLVLSMVKVGDETGKMDETLEKVCEFYDREIPAAIKQFMTWFEYAIIFVAGGVVLFIIMATLMPIYSLVKIMNK